MSREKDVVASTQAKAETQRFALSKSFWLFGLAKNEFPVDFLKFEKINKNQFNII